MNVRQFIRTEIRKHFLNENAIANNNVFELTFYSVTFETNDSIDNEYYGLDFDRAKLIFESNPDIPDRMINRSDLSMSFTKVTNKYQFVHELDNEYETIEDYPIDEYYKDQSVYKLIHEGDWEEIGSRKIEPINKKSDELLQDVEHYYKSEYGRYKYNTINVYDEDETYYGCIQLRVANHTENINNIDRFGQCNYYISVVIANHDVTKQRFGMSNAFERRRNEFELIFGEDDNLDDVINEINSLIEDCKEKILNK